MIKLRMIAVIYVISHVSLASDEQPDPEFLEWLGQVAEVEDLGIDVDDLLDSQADDSESEAEPEAAE